MQAEPVLASLQKEHKQETGRLVIVSAAPDKARRQADLAVADLAAAQQLLATAETKRMEAESALRGVSEQLRQRQVRTTQDTHYAARTTCFSCLASLQLGQQSWSCCRQRPILCVGQQLSANSSKPSPTRPCSCPAYLQQQQTHLGMFCVTVDGADGLCISHGCAGACAHHAGG